MGYALHDLCPDHAYLTFEKRFQLGIVRCSKDNLANLVRERQKMVIKKDRAGSHHVVLRKQKISLAIS